MLESLLREYKDITEEIIEKAKIDELDSIEGLVEDRGSVLNKIASGNHEKEEIKRIFTNLGMAELEDEMNKMLSLKKEGIKEEIRKTQENKVAKNSYNTVRSKAVFLSEQI